MGVKITQLSNAEIKSLKPKDKAYVASDGRGLHLLVKPNGSKLWEFNFICPITKKRKKTSFGIYPDVTLLKAREKREDYRKFVTEGINPIEHNRKLKKAKEIKEERLFQNVISNWLKLRKRELVPRSYQRVESLLLNDVLPYFKNRDIRDIHHSEIAKVIKIKNKKASVSAKRLLQYLNRLWLYGISSGYIDFNIIANIDKNSLITKKMVKHYPKIVDLKVFSELVNAIYGYTGHYSVRNILKFVLHIPLRASNLVTIQWGQIDFENRLLTIPRGEMKIKDSNYTDFKMPLADEVVSILDDQRKLTGNRKYIFVSDTGSHINIETPNRALQRLGFNDEKRGRKQRLHSFRGTFRSLVDTYQREHKADFEVKEIALDHRVGNTVTQSYSHLADYEEQLRELMNWWSGFIVNSLGRIVNDKNL